MSVEILSYARPTVYAIRHNVTGRIYVGATINLNRRIYEHITALRYKRHSIELMQEDFDTYGNDLSFFILFDSHKPGDTASYCFDIEKLYIEILGTRNPDKGYNYKEPSKSFDLNDLKEYKISEKDEPSYDPRYRIDKDGMQREVTRIRGCT